MMKATTAGLLPESAIIGDITPARMAGSNARAANTDTTISAGFSSRFLGGAISPSAIGAPKLCRKTMEPADVSGKSSTRRRLTLHGLTGTDPGMQILTKRLKLRHARLDDLEAMHAVLSDPRSTTWWSTPPHESLDVTREWLVGMIAGNAEGSDDFVIERDGVVIGKAGFWALPEVGYILHPDHWGLGLATEAVEAAVQHVFATRPVDVLTADVDPANAGSLRLLERLGFTQTGSAVRTWNIGGEWKDSIYFALTRDAWQTRVRTVS